MNKEIILATATAGAALVAGAVEITVDTSVLMGRVKPVNGIGQPPMVGMPMSAPMMHYLGEAGIPYSRLHDVGGAYGGNRYVDISNIFPDPDADENDPASYYFQHTDILLAKLVEQGTEPFFRLGETIQNSWEFGMKIDQKEEWRVKPPKDFAKWARIVEHIIRHYTEGWADGFRYKITYWEIWNEPDNRENPENSPLWRAPFEEYIRFYGVVAPYLKEKFPHLKIGGYGSCGFYAGANSASAAAAAHSDPRAAHFIDCAHKFLAAARDNKWPLDFFSFHSYSAPVDALRQVAFADRLLNNYGFTGDRTERIYNEWLPFVSHDNLGTAKQAAGIAAELVALQNGPCDVACIYDGRCGIGNYSPLFNPMTYGPHKAYYVFVAFNELRKLGIAVKCASDDPEVYVIAAAKDGKAAVMVVNLSGNSKPMELVASSLKVRKCHMISEETTYSEVTMPTELPAWSVLLAEYGQ